MTRMGEALAQQSTSERRERTRETIASWSMLPDDFNLLAGVLQQIYRAV